jgi:hypothetical protein
MQSNPLFQTITNPMMASAACKMLHYIMRVNAFHQHHLQLSLPA